MTKIFAVNMLKVTVWIIVISILLAVATHH